MHFGAFAPKCISSSSSICHRCMADRCTFHLCLSPLRAKGIGFGTNFSECRERTFSTLKRLKTWLRNQTGEERLTGLALMNIGGENRIKLTDDNEILDSFVSKKLRRLGLIV